MSRRASGSCLRRLGWCPCKRHNSRHALDPPAQPGIHPPHFCVLCSYNNRGVRGYWSYSPPKQVIMHDVYVAGPQGDHTWKRMVYKGFHLWNSEVDKVVLDGRMVPAAPPAQLAPRMLALEPGLALNTTTELEFRNRTIQARGVLVWGPARPVRPLPC